MINYDLIKNWYGSTLPKRFDAANLVKFCYRSNQFLRIVNPLVNSQLLMHHNAPSAYTDGSDCYLPGLFFSQEFYSQALEISNESEQILACLALINGAQIHESLHIEYLGENCDIKKLTESRNWLTNYNYKEFYTLFNIVEDQFSEFVFGQHNPYYNRFLILLRQIMFNKNVFIRALNSYDDDSKNNKNRLALLVAYRNENNTSYPDYLIKSAVSILNRANNINLTLDNRLSLAQELFDLLISREEAELSNDRSPLRNDSVPFELNQFIKDIVQTIFNNNNRLLEEIQAMVNDVLNNDHFNFVINYNDVKDFSISETIKSSTNYARFCDFLKFAKTLKIQPGQPIDKGSKVAKNLIHRIAIDNTVFRRRTDEQLNLGEPEIIVLIDLSYSMVSSELINPVIEVSKGIFESLFNAGLAISVYGHTTKNYNGVEIIGIAANNLPLSNPRILQTTNDFEDRFNRVLSVHNAANADGFAIEFVASRFSQRRGDKAIIVLSDGKPSAISYNATGIEHTKTTVKNLRDSNIKVLSLSLVKDVMEANNTIYGQEFNLAAFEGNLESQFRKIVGQIIKR